MSPRVGMIVALLATALLVVATVAPIPVAGQTNAWWSGHPALEGEKPIEAKDVYLSLFTSKGCNTGGDGKCEGLKLGTGFRVLRYVELGLVLVLALVVGLLGLMYGRSRRQTFAKLVMLAAATSAIGAVVLLVMGPDIKASKPVGVPIGPGLILFFVGTALGIATAMLAFRPLARKPVFRPLPSQMPAQQVPGGFDVQALLAEGDAVRPAQLGPEPQIGRPQSPGGMLPGPAGPLVPPSGPHAQPLFNSAPQLRPLYEATGGHAPLAAAPVQFPTRGPTPMPHAAVNAALGLDTPPPVVAPPASPVIPVPPIVAPPSPVAPKLPPPVRTKPVSAAPPIPSLAGKRPPPPATKPPQPTKMSAAVPPPKRSETEDPADLMATQDYEKVLATGDSTSPNVPFDSSTSEHETSAFQSDEDIETAARDKIDNTDPEVNEAPPRPSVSRTDVELVQPRMSTSVISSATPPPRMTPSPSRAKTPPPAARVPVSTASQSLPPPAEASASAGPSPACPQCEAPMGWVEEHLRFYCKSCRMYF